MDVCTHTVSNELYKGRLLHHPDSVETQIKIGSAIKPLELFQWTIGSRDFGGPLREETIIFFIQQARLADDTCEVVNEMAAIVDRRLRQSTTKRFQSLVRGRIEDFAIAVTESFWERVFDPADTIARWAQISFWPCVYWLSQDLLKKKTFEEELFPSFEASPSGPQACKPHTPDSPDLDNAILLGELIDLLTPVQRRAFILRHRYGLSLAEIAFELSCTDRTVRNHLTAAVTMMREAVA